MYQFSVIALIIIPLVISSPVDYEPRGFIDIMKGFRNKSPTNGDCVTKCPWFQIYKFIPHDDCNKYCVCFSRIQFAVECQKGTYFSAVHDTCVDPTEAECGKVKGCLGQCPHESLSTHVLLPHEDCNKYCQCKKGRPVPENCAPNYQFNAERQQCLPLEEAECNKLNGFTTSTSESLQTTPSSFPSTSSSTTSEPLSTPYLSSSSPSPSSTPSTTAKRSSTTHSTVTTTENLTITPEALTTQDQPSSDFIAEPMTLGTMRSPSDRSVSNCVGHCPQSDNPNSVVLLAHKNCTKYCRCKEGNPVAKNCPPHYHFSLDREMCLPSVLTDCHHLANH